MAEPRSTGRGARRIAVLVLLFPAFFLCYYAYDRLHKMPIAKAEAGQAVREFLLDMGLKKAKEASRHLPVRMHKVMVDGAADELSSLCLNLGVKPGLLAGISDATVVRADCNPGEGSSRIVVFAVAKYASGATAEVQAQVGRELLDKEHAVIERLFVRPIAPRP